MQRKLDSYDRRILAKLQTHGDMGPGELSEVVHLSTSQCSRRLQRLRSEGYVDRTVAILSQKRLRIGMTIWVLTALKNYEPENVRAFHDRVRANAAILECHKLTGEADYLLKICTRDLESYNDILTRDLLAAPEVATVRSAIVLESVKSTTQLPLDWL